MARPIERKVEYFPHLTKHGETMYIIEDRYGNDGYALWFKLLETLGHTEGHVYEAGIPSKMQYLAAKAHVSKERAVEILDLFAELDAIDGKLWHAQQTIWCQHFVDGVAIVYDKRVSALPVSPSIRHGNRSFRGFPSRKPEFPGISVTETGVSGAETPQSIVEDSIGYHKREQDARAREAGPRDNPWAEPPTTDLWPDGSVEKKTLLVFQQATPVFKDARGNLEAIPQLVRLARARGDPEKILPAMVKLYEQLRAGDMPSMNDANKRFWARQPMTPKGMLQVWERLEPEATAFIASVEKRLRVKSFLDEEDDDADN